MSEVTGDIRLEFDEQKLKVNLVFNLNKDGQKWNKDGVAELLRKNDILSFVEPSSINDAITNYRKNEDDGSPVAFEIASGLPPEKSEDDKIEWSEFSIPEEISDKAKDAFLNVGNPVVFNFEEVKTKVKETEKVKPGLPFLPAKEKEVIRVVKKEVKKKVEVEQEVIDKGYIRSGNIIANIKQGKIGKPGKNVLGMMVPPEKPKKVVVYIGDGIRRNKDKIVAEKTGFIRRGVNWVDIIGYQMQEIRVYTSKNGSTCLIDFIPGKGGIPKLEDILKRAQDLNFYNLLPAQELSSMFNSAVKNNEAIKSKSISLPCDAVFDLIVSEDKLNAFLTIRKASGAGKPLSLKEVGSIISSSGFKGMNIAQIRKDILDYYKGNEFELKDYIIARGTPPVRGRAANISFTADFLHREEALRLEENLRNLYSENAKSENSPLYKFPVNEINNIAIVKKNNKVAELIPYAAGKSGVDVYGTEIPAVHGNDPDMKIFEGIKISAKHLLSTKKGLFAVARAGSTYYLNVFDYEDSNYKITVSEDKMQASITINPSKGVGNSISFDKIEKDVKEQGIVNGVNLELLNNCVKQANDGKSMVNVVIAQGVEPRHGSGSRLQFYYQVISGRSLYSGVADSAGKKRSVKNGDLIAEIIRSNEKVENGMNIFGEVVEAREGLPINIGINESIKQEVTEDGKLQFYAASTGEIFYNGKLLEINDSLVVNSNVTQQTGNINFSGSVTISGSVAGGLSIFSGGDIKIAGMVEGALLSSNGSIYIAGGVRGEKKAVLRSKQNIAAMFAEHTLILAVGNIKLKSACLHSNLKCNNKLFMAPVNSKILGGIIKSKKGLEVFNIGSERGLRTHISFGQDYLVGDQIELEVREVEKLKKKIYKFDHIMMKIEKGQFDKRITLEQVRREKLKVLKLIEKRGIRLLNLREKFEEHFPSEIIIRGTIFPGIVIESHGRYHEVTSKKTSIKIYFDLERGRIQEVPLEK